jgi:hypothetical protein
MRCSYAGLTLGLLLTAFAACQKEEAPPREKPVDAGLNQGPAVDPDLAQAVKSAGSAAAAHGADNGPPQNGIFTAGAADKELTKGSPPKVTLGSDGAEPRVKLAPAPKPGSKRSGTIEIATQLDPRQGALPILLSVTIEAQKVKADADAGVSPIPMVARVTGASINVPGVPAEALAALGRLKGARVDYQVLPNGGAVGFKLDAAKNLEPEFRDAVRSLSETLALITLPYPDKPLGAGAYWMATTRDGILGLDLVTYRMVKVDKIVGDEVTLTVNAKRYSASPTLDIDGLPPDAPRDMLEFQSPSDGSLTLSVGDATPRSGLLNTGLMALLGPAEAKQHRALEIHTRATITLGGS